MPTLEEAKQMFMRKRCFALADFLVHGARLRGGEAAAKAAAAKLAPLLSDAPPVAPVVHTDADHKS